MNDKEAALPMKSYMKDIQLQRLSGLLRPTENFFQIWTSLEVDRADFGLLFKEMDAFVVHGGLGTTVEAMRMRKPVAVTWALFFARTRLKGTS